MAQKLTDLEVTEVSVVDAPANKGARIALFKRDGEGKTPFEKVKAWLGVATHADKAAAETVVKTVEAAGALAAAAASIIEDDAVTEKAASLRHSSHDFRTHVDSLAPDDGDRVGKSGDPMSADIKKALGLADTATDAETAAALTKALADAKTGADALAKAQADLKAAASDLAFAKMSAAHQAYANDMDGDEKAAFAAKTPAERDALMATKKSASQVELEKRDTEIADLRKRLDAQEDERARDVITKRVEPLKHIAKADELGTLLHKVAKVDKAAADAIEALFQTANEAIEKGALFGEIGSGARGSGSAAAAIEAGAKELQKKDATMSIAKARTEFRRLNPDIAKQETEEARQGRRAA